VQDSDAVQGRLDASRGGGFARGGEDPQILSSGQVLMESRLVDDRADARERGVRAPSGPAASWCPRRRA